MQKTKTNSNPIETIVSVNSHQTRSNDHASNLMEGIVSIVDSHPQEMFRLQSFSLAVLKLLLGKILKAGIIVYKCPPDKLSPHVSNPITRSINE